MTMYYQNIFLTAKPCEYQRFLLLPNGHLNSRDFTKQQQDFRWPARALSHK